MTTKRRKVRKSDFNSVFREAAYAVDRVLRDLLVLKKRYLQVRK